MKHYFVSYISINGNNTTYGHCGVNIDKEILSMDDVEEVANQISVENKFSKMVTITNFIELRKGSK